jgi:hypothetical protein
MNGMRFDWRWIVAFVFLAILVGGQRLPWPIVMLALAAGGGFLIYLGWNAWQGGSGGGGGKRVTYWRGQRIELPPERGSSSLPPLRTLAPALIYFVLGGAMVLGALAMIFQQVSG